MLKDIYERRPFKTRNADEFDLSQILQLFVNPIEGLTSPFDYENSIIKGRMGSGKTMYLRANHAYHLYGILPSLQSGNGLILPVSIRLSDFQHINDPKKIYRAIIIKIIEGLSSIYEDLQDIKDLARIHLGMKALVQDTRYASKMNSALKSLIALESNEYTERLTDEVGGGASAKPRFFEFSTNYKNTKFTEIKKKQEAGIEDIEECYRNLFSDQDAKILLLIDEAGALDKKFFKEDADGCSSLFEVLMNQFRTADFIRTKIALYPHSYSDILTETRYGDVITLEEDIYQSSGYRSLRKRTIDLIENYISDGDFEYSRIEAGSVFEISNTSENGDCLEQIIYGSNGNLRRLIQLLDLTMTQAYRRNNGENKVTLEDVSNALKANAARAEAEYGSLDLKFLESIVKVCKARSTFRFQFPSMSPVLSKYTMRSQEFNIVNILDFGSGRRGTVYAFDYSFCVYQDIPTHYLKGTEKIERRRSLDTGEWISRVTTVSKDLIEQANIPGKIEGTVEFLRNSSGFAQGTDGKQYFVTQSHIIDDDQRKPLIVGKRIRFYPTLVADSPMAIAIEIL